MTAVRNRGGDRRLWALIWARLRRDPVALGAAIVLLALAIVVIAAPLTAPVTRCARSLRSASRRH